MAMCSADAQWWSCSFENQFYTGCCTVNACHQTPIGCPSTAPPTMTTVTIPGNVVVFTLPHLIETHAIKTRYLSSASGVALPGTPDTVMNQPTVLPTGGWSSYMTTAPPMTTTTHIFSSSSSTNTLTSPVNVHRNESTSASAGTPTPSGVTVGGLDRSMPTPAVVVVALACALLGIVGLAMLFQAWKRRRERMKSSSPSGEHSTADQEEQQMEEQEYFNVPVNPEAFPFTPVRSTAGGPGHRKSSTTSFDSTARPVSAASMTPAGYNNASPTFGDMDISPYDDRYTNVSPTLGDMDTSHVHDARYTNVSPTLGDMDSGPSRYASGVGISPTLEEHDGRPSGSDIDAFPPPPKMGRVLTKSYKGGERSERMHSIFNARQQVEGSNSRPNIWAGNDDGHLKDGKKQSWI